jgi:histidinol-phosphatase
MNPYLETAKRAVAAASVPILEYFHGGFEVELKPDRTPVTVADREAEREIRRVLQQDWPEHAIYGEEFGSDALDAEYLWLVDPIDGTKAFVHGYGMFSTQVALMHGGEIITGVSAAPVMGEMAWAANGEGAWLDGQPLRVSTVGDIDSASISTGNIGSLARSRRWRALGEIMSAANRTRGYGDFYHYHRLAAGQLDAVIESDVNILDIAAVSLIIREAGGVFTDLDGRPVNLETRSVLAANPTLHAQLLGRLNQE